MTPDKFMDVVTLVRNRLEKQDTRFREAVPIEKRVAIAFRSSHQRCSMKKGVLRNFRKFAGKHLCQSLFFNKVSGLRPEETMAQVLPYEFCVISKNTFLTEHLWTTASVLYGDWELLPQSFKNICCRKIDCGKHYRLWKYFIKFPRTPTGTAKAIAKFKETTNCKIPHTAGATWAPGTDFS